MDNRTEAEKEADRREWAARPFYRVFVMGPGYWARAASREEAFAILRREGYRKKTGVTIWEFDDQIRGAYFDGWGCAYFLNPDLPDTPGEHAAHKVRTEIPLKR